MEWVRDKTGRFPKRPHYRPEELEIECEQLIISFLERRHGRAELPVSTDDLTVLLESKVADLDMYADLSGEDGEVEGVTEFRPGQKPRTKIARGLSATSYMENRLRTTLTHELGHVHLHGFLFELQPTGQPLFAVSDEARVNKCKRETIVGARETDWMEWQAGYACGAILMPRSALRETILAFAEERQLPAGKISVGTPEGKGLIDHTAGAFQTSRDAARVRLLQRGYLGDGALGPSLFQGT